MAIEIFLIEEAENLISDIESIEEWKKRVEELGLEGQKELIKPEKSPIPFLRMKEAEIRVYKELCPERTELKEYKESTIPLRVLSMIALAEQEKYFGKIEIWHNYSKTDPLAVGYKATATGDASFYTNNGMFLIARWGDELKSFAELKQEAEKLFKEKRRREYEEKLRNLDFSVEKYFEGEWVNF